MPTNKKASEEVEALILRAYPSGDFDMVYRLLCPGRGKIAAFAKSVKKSKRRFSSLPEPFDIGKATIKRGRGDLYFFEGFIHKKSYLKLRESLAIFSTACVVCECFDALTIEDHQETPDLENRENDPSHHSNNDIYQTAVDCLTALSQLNQSELTDSQIYLPADRAVRKLMRLSGFIEDSSRQEDRSPKEQWKTLLSRVEKVIERKLHSAVNL